MGDSNKLLNRNKCIKEHIYKILDWWVQQEAGAYVIIINRKDLYKEYYI